MKTENITKGMEITSENGYIVLDDYNGSIVYATEHCTDVDGNEIEKTERMYTYSEIEQMLKYVDGRNHKVRWEE